MRPSGGSQEFPEKTVEPDLEAITFEGWILVLMFLVLGLVVFAQFFSRYMLNSPIGWSEEAARYLLIFVTFIGTIVGVQNSSHIFVEYFYRFVPERLGKIMTLVVDLIQVAFFAWLSWQAKFLAELAVQSMNMIPLPKSIVYWVVFGSFVLATVRSVGITWMHLRKSDSSKLVQVRIEALKQRSSAK